MAPKRPFSELEWQLIPESVRQYIQQLESALFGLNQRVEKLETRSRKDSTNSGKPPSSDSPFKRPERKRKKSKRAKGD
jgi:transposase